MFLKSMKSEKYFCMCNNKRFSSIIGGNEMKISIAIKTVHKLKLSLGALILLDISQVEQVTHTSKK